MLLAFTALLVFQLLGDVAVRMVALPLPGPVLGMALLFVALALYGRVPDHLKRLGIRTARALLSSQVAGAFAGIAMGLNALATALLLPMLWGLFANWF